MISSVWPRALGKGTATACALAAAAKTALSPPGKERHGTGHSSKDFRAVQRMITGLADTIFRIVTTLDQLLIFNGDVSAGYDTEICTKYEVSNE